MTWGRVSGRIHFQHLCTAWYNRTRPERRRGPLWAGRFKNTVLESGLAVWACWAYVERNDAFAPQEIVTAVDKTGKNWHIDRPQALTRFLHRLAGGCRGAHFADSVLSTPFPGQTGAVEG